jgi:saccharopine dehydrogenase-like NADP-dependent oxidoreductase
MRVAIIGVGAVGQVIAKVLKDSPFIEHIVLADIREGRVRSLVKELGPGKISGTKIDASDIHETTRLLRDVDFVVNAALPRFNHNILDAAVAARCNYMDLASSTAVAERPEELFQSKQTASELAYDPKFQEVERSAFLFMGADPGLTNVFARYGADQLDEVHEILVRDGDNSTVEGYDVAALWAPDVVIEECSQWPETWVNGQYVVGKPLETGVEVFRFPDPVGEMTVYTVAHEEIGTLPHFLNKGGTLKRVDFKLALSDTWVATMKVLMRFGLHRADLVDIGGVKVAPRSVLTALMPKAEDLAGKARGWSCIGTIVRGKSGHAKKQVYTYMLNSQEEAYQRLGVTVTVFHVGVPAAAVVELFAEGKITRRGAFPPEVLDPRPIISRCVRYGISIHSEVTEQHSVTHTAG